MTQETENRPEEEGEFRLFRSNQHSHIPKTLPATPVEGEIPKESRRKKRREKKIDELTQQRQPKYKKSWKNKAEDDKEQ